MRVSGDMKNKMPCKRVSLYIGALVGSLEGVRFLGLFETKG